MFAKIETKKFIDTLAVTILVIGGVLIYEPFLGKNLIISNTPLQGIVGTLFIFMAVMLASLKK